MKHKDRLIVSDNNFKSGSHDIDNFENESKWICPECEENFEGDLLRCVCGYEGEPILAEKSLYSKVVEKKSDEAETYKTKSLSNPRHTFGFGLLNSLGFFVPIYNIYLIVNLTKYTDLRIPLIILLLGLPIAIGRLSSNLFFVLFLSVLWFSLVLWLLYRQSNIRYAIGTVTGLVVLNIFILIYIFRFYIFT